MTNARDNPFTENIDTLIVLMLQYWDMVKLKTETSHNLLLGLYLTFLGIATVLCSLHWLPVKFRIDFKILLLTFKAIYGHAPGYLTDLIAIKVQTRYTLRSASSLTLNHPSVKLKKTLGDRAFSSAAPILWNSLPLHIRLVDNFERCKSVLKTHLFKLAFDK